MPLTEGKKPTILLTGVGGQVGNALLSPLSRIGNVVPCDIHPVPGVLGCRSVDFTSRDALVTVVREVRPDLIVNPAAYTAVDRAEQEPEIAHLVNATAPGILGEEAAKLNAGIIHYSTDYVFDGSGSLPRDELAPTGPLNVYGKSKLAGEAAVLAANPAALVLRTSWVFSAVGANFVKTMLRLGAERETLKIVADQIGAPTSAHFLSAMTMRALEVAQEHEPNVSAGLKARRGIYHLCPSGETSWHGFALTIFKLARQADPSGLPAPLVVRDVAPITTDDFPTPARRPLNSRLNCAKFQNTFSQPLPPWQEGLLTVMQSLSGSSCLRL